MMVDTMGCKAFHEFCLQRDNVGLDISGLGSRKSQARTCDEKHSGLCCIKDQQYFRKARKIGKHLFHLVRALKMPIGETLVRFKHKRRRDAHFDWPAQILGNPQAIIFVIEAVESGDGPIDIKEPLAYATNYSIALDLVKDAAGILEDAWDCSSVVHRSPNAGPLSRTMLVDLGTVSRLTMEKPHVEAVEVDPLEAALQEATSNIVKQRRRV